MSLGTKVLSAMLRRVVGGGNIPTDVILLQDHPVLADTDPLVEVNGEQWRFERVSGELSLRAALPRPQGHTLPLVAALKGGMQVPRDVGERCLKRQPLHLWADDVILAFTGRPCMHLQDPVLSRSVFAHAQQLSQLAPSWTLGSLVTATDVQEMLAAASLGLQQDVGRIRPAELLARWIIEGVPTISPALIQTLERSLGSPGTYLAEAVRQTSVDGVLLAGALSVTEQFRTKPSGLSLSSLAQWRALRELVSDALELAWPKAPERCLQALDQAEAVYKAMGSPKPHKHLLLRSAFEAGLECIANRCSTGQIPDEEWLDDLGQNLHNPNGEALTQALSDLCRLARFATTLQAGTSTETVDWLNLAKTDTAWADLALRRLRRQQHTLPESLQSTADDVINRALAVRDQLNQSFAQSLTSGLTALQGNSDFRGGQLPLHRVSSHIIRPLINDGQRVLLIVLDGCDLSTFYELVLSLPSGYGLRCPALNDADSQEDFPLDPDGLYVAVAPLPTVTAVGRRAIFAGEIPGRSTLSPRDLTATDASGDKHAFDQNKKLQGVDKALFLKGDLYDEGAELRHLLQHGSKQLVSMVLNGVDDALSSKQTTAMGPWSWSALGPKALTTLKTAIDNGWVVLVTADHGHTPHMSAHRKAASRGAGNRYSADPIEGSVLLSEPAVAQGAYYFLSRVGAWMGQQHRGYHGGASLEEMVVPLAFIGRNGKAPTQPYWWASLEAPEQVVHPPSSQVTPVERSAETPAKQPAQPADQPSAKETPIPATASSQPVVEVEAQPKPTKKDDAAPKSTPEQPAPVTMPTPTASTKAQDETEEQLPLWAQQIQDEAHRLALLHLAKHGSLTETELNHLTGSPRKSRRFSKKIDQYLALLPFGVRTEAAPSGKRYVRIL